MSGEARGGQNGDLDPSDWLARQFGAPEQPEQPQQAEQPAPGLPWEQPVVAEPPAAAPSPFASGGFDWGLGGDVPATPVQPAAPTPPVTPNSPVTPTPTVGPPTVAFPEPPAPDPALWGAPPTTAEPPTVALPWESAPEPIIHEAPTELLRSAEAEPLAPSSGNPLDALFGETAFKDYEDQGVLATSPFATAGAGDLPPRQKGDPLPSTQRTLLWVAGTLLAVLALVALFFVGTRLPGLLGSAPASIASTLPTVTSTPTPTVPVGPASIGVHKWSDLRGGECLSPFTTVWAETFTVVDCATPHTAQMVFRGTFPPTAASPSTATPAPTATATAPGGYPGIAALQAQINLLCTAPGVIDLAAAGAYTDIQFQASYAASPQEWANGQHDYFCFVTRKSGDPLTVTVATAH